MNREKEVILFYVKHMPEKELFPLNRLVFLLDSVGQIAREDHSKKLKMMTKYLIQRPTIPAPKIPRSSTTGEKDTGS